MAQSDPVSSTSMITPQLRQLKMMFKEFKTKLMLERIINEVFT